MDEPSPVVVDTDVWSRLFLRRNDADERVPLWRAVLLGRSLTVAMQTRGELLAGALQGHWGAERLGKLTRQLDRTPTIPVDREVTDTYARLTAELHRSGHALHAKVHTGDRWIAATAVQHGLPLLSGDGIYRDVEGLDLMGW